MGLTIKGSVGISCKNNSDDVTLVQTQLNKYIKSNILGPLALLEVTGKVGSSSGKTVEAIKTFQERVCAFKLADGQISPDGKTWAALSQEPSITGEQALMSMYALNGMSAPPPTAVPSDLWQAAMRNLHLHSLDVRLKQGYLVILVDFRLDSYTKRMWLVDLRNRNLLLEEWVGHGKGSADDSTPRWAIRFSNTPKSNQSCVGGFVTQNTWTSELGGQKGTAMAIDGLDKTNSAAVSRGIRFHGATYVKPGKVGRSDGCFVTRSEVNEHLVRVVSGGAYVFAYGGENWLGS